MLVVVGSAICVRLAIFVYPRSGLLTDEVVQIINLFTQENFVVDNNVINGMPAVGYSCGCVI